MRAGLPFGSFGMAMKLQATMTAVSRICITNQKLMLCCIHVTRGGVTVVKQGMNFVLDCAKSHSVSQQSFLELSSKRSFRSGRIAKSTTGQT